MFINELPDVLMWREIQEYVKAIREIQAMYLNDPNDPDLHLRKGEQYLLDKIQTKEEFIRRIDDYAANGNLIWQGQFSSHCDLLLREDIENALRYSTCESGERRHNLFTERSPRWAFHLADYAKAVNEQDGQYVLELATGGSLGTWAVLKEFPANSRLLSIDIDYAATKNADGLANYFGIADRVASLPANFWFLPFVDETFDCVCTHSGLDESRETPTVLQEAARVLKPGGRFVVTARMYPYDRQKRFMNLFGITAAECNPLLKKARLYSGPDDLILLAQDYQLELTDKMVYEPESSHHRVVLVFTK